MAHAQIDAAGGNDSGRSTATVFRGSVLSQAVLALTGVSELAEHESPGAATLYVLIGRVKLTAGDEQWEGEAGDLLVVPPRRHSVRALEDSAVLLSVGRL